MSSEKQVQYYKTYQDDIVENANQDFTLPEDYIWVRTRKRDKLARKVSYALAHVFAFFYTKLILHLKVVKVANMKDYKNTGAIIYGNHTQPLGDVFIPCIVCSPKRFYTIASPANLGVPVLGRILPWLGALPIPSNFKQMKEFVNAIQKRLEEKNCIIIYPEQHVWPYYTDIRPYDATSFDYAIKNKVPAFCMTTTYQKHKFFKRPKATTYLDGPFFADEMLPSKEQKIMLRDQIYSCMQKRSEESTYSYIEYRPVDETIDDKN